MVTGTLSVLYFTPIRRELLLLARFNFMTVYYMTSKCRQDTFFSVVSHNDETQC